MLREIAIADAYGAGFEFSERTKINTYNDLTAYQPHELHGLSGKYTDDTQMSVAVAELILAHREWTDELIADAFVGCFKRDPRSGYALGFQQFLTEVNSGNEFIQKIRNTSNRNGAAMRSVPLGVIKDKQELLAKAKQQAALTHDTELGISSSCTVALVAHFGLHHRGEIADIKAFLAKEGFSDWHYEWRAEVSVNAFDTISAALTCLINYNNMKELLAQCVDLGGDTDSVAAIAVGLASCFEEYDKTLPEALINALDEGEYGLAFLDSLDSQLMQSQNSGNR